MTTDNSEIMRMIGDMKGEFGELRGQMRELMHNMNNLTTKIDSLSSRADQNHAIPDEISQIKARLTILEAEKQKRDGAMSFGAMFLKSPVLAWMAAAAIVLYAKFKGAGYVQ